MKSSSLNNTIVNPQIAHSDTIRANLELLAKGKIPQFFDIKEAKQALEGGINFTQKQKDKAAKTIKKFEESLVTF